VPVPVAHAAARTAGDRAGDRRLALGMTPRDIDLARHTCRP
jgi:hypothetical protein